MAGTGGDGRARVQHAHPTRRPKPCGPDTCVTGMWLRAAEWSHYREAARKNPTAVEQKG
jgi:hypothetical protein